MIGLVMAGGRGTRMRESVEKLLLGLNKPAILKVITSLEQSKCFETVYAITSHHSPNTEKLLIEKGKKILRSPGLGYVADLNGVLKDINDDILVVSGDMPLLDSEVIKQLVSRYDQKHIWTSILVTKEFINANGLQSEFIIKHEGIDCSYTGISLINSRQINSLNKVTEHYEIIDDIRIAFNMNTKEELAKLRVLSEMLD